MFLCMAAIDTPRFLLRLGLGNASGQVKHNFMAHTGLQIWGQFDEEIRPWKGCARAAQAAHSFHERRERKAAHRVRREGHARHLVRGRRARSVGFPAQRARYRSLDGRQDSARSCRAHGRNGAFPDGCRSRAPSPPTPEPMSDSDRAATRAAWGDRASAVQTVEKITAHLLPPEITRRTVEDMLRTSRAAWLAWPGWTSEVGRTSRTKWPELPFRTMCSPAMRTRLCRLRCRPARCSRACPTRGRRAGCGPSSAVGSGGRGDGSRSGDGGERAGSAAPDRLNSAVFKR